jgi:hypothetical protein
MNDLRLAPTVGIVASLAVLAALAAPYVLAESAADVGLYYGSGALNPLLGGLFALVVLIVFAAGREGRTDPELAAGAALALGLFTLLIVVAWALTVRVDVLVIATGHRWAVVAVAALLPASALWFARALNLL